MSWLRETQVRQIPWLVCYRLKIKYVHIHWQKVHIDIYSTLWDRQIAYDAWYHFAYSWIAEVPVAPFTNMV